MNCISDDVKMIEHKNDIMLHLEQKITEQK